MGTGFPPMFRTTFTLGLLAAAFGTIDIAQAQYYPPYYQAPSPYSRGPAPAEWDIEPVAWMMRDFVLMHSLIGEARQVEIARWPLGA